MAKQIFDRQRVRRAFDKAADTYDAAALLQKEVCRRLLERLDVVKHSPAWILDAGSGTGEAIRPLHKKYKKAELVALDISEAMLDKTTKQAAFFRRPHCVCGDLEFLPFADQSFDLVFSNLALQWCNDLDLALAECMRVLKPGGLLVFTTFGPDTLKELRASWKAIDGAVHVNPFIDMHDIGDGLVRRGFASPVMEAEMIKVTYQEVDALMYDLKAIGANVTAQGHRQGLLTRNLLAKLRSAYEAFRDNGRLPASYEIIYGHAWRPETSAGSTGPETKQVQVNFGR